MCLCVSVNCLCTLKRFKLLSIMKCSPSVICLILIHNLNINNGKWIVPSSAREAVKWMDELSALMYLFYLSSYSTKESTHSNKKKSEYILRLGVNHTKNETLTQTTPAEFCFAANHGLTKLC